MILYFTGTGNSAFIAKRIAEKTGDTAVDVFPMIRENDYGRLSSSRPFVVVCPTYGWQIPHVLGNWLKKTRLSGSRKLYFVMTCGDGIGNAGGYAKRFCEKKGMEYMGCGKVVMPENYVAMFPVPDRTEAERIIGKAIPQADQIAEHIRKENPLPKAEISLLDRFLSTVVNPVFYKLFVHAGKFRTTERCTGCGACVRLCPLSNIRLEDGSPVWGSDCTHCMACICRCPEQAIEYGKASLGKPRYQRPGAGEGNRGPQKNIEKICRNPVQVLKKCCII